MAAAVTKTKYGQRATYGSLAYDFNNPELYPNEEYGSPLDTPARPRKQERTSVKTRARAVPRTKQGVAPLAIAGTFIAAFILVIGLMARIQLVDVSATSVQLQNQLDSLQEEQVKLRIAYESTFNLTEIEEYATSVLGMQKPKADQIFYIDTSSPDKAAIISDGTNDSLVDKVSDFILGIGAYFR